MSRTIVGEPYWANEAFQKEDSKNLVIHFHVVQKKMAQASLDAGMPVFKEVTHVRIIVPGDQKLVIDRPISEAEAAERYPIEWARWKVTKENKVLGFPIENWPAITENQKAVFKAMNIHTVEQFASLPDSVGEKIMGFYDLRKRANVFVESGKDAELIANIKAESRKEVDELKVKLEALQAMFEAQTAPAKAAK